MLSLNGSGPSFCEGYSAVYVYILMSSSLIVKIHYLFLPTKAGQGHACSLFLRVHLSEMPMKAKNVGAIKVCEILPFQNQTFRLVISGGVHNCIHVASCAICFVPLAKSSQSICLAFKY